jgi:hypothetical protein
MKKDRLVLVDKAYHFSIKWYLAEEHDFGATLGEDSRPPSSKPPADRGDWEHWAANKALWEMQPRPRRNKEGFYWDTRAEAMRALAVVKEVMKQGRPMPEWAQKALAEGWKPPKGWRA